MRRVSRWNGWWKRGSSRNREIISAPCEALWLSRRSPETRMKANLRFFFPFSFSKLFCRANVRAIGHPTKYYRIRKQRCSPSQSNAIIAWHYGPLSGKSTIWKILRTNFMSNSFSSCQTMVLQLFVQHEYCIIRNSGVKYTGDSA